MNEREYTNADDVLSFLDSLPDNKNRSPDSKKDDNGEDAGNENILEFLNELEQSNLNIKKNSIDQKTTHESVTDMSKDLLNDDPLQPLDVNKQELTISKNTLVESKNPDNTLYDPINSISNWWSSSGQATVTNLWSKTTEQATHLKNKIASDDITAKLTDGTMITNLANQLTKIVIGETEEIIRIHLVHDLINFPMLSFHVESQFDKVLSSQVQGDIRIFVDEWDHIKQSYTSTTSTRKLNLFYGKSSEGEKLCSANLENAIKLFEKSKKDHVSQGYISDTGTEDNISDIFIGVIPVGIPLKEEASHEIDSIRPGNFNFTIILKDITNNLTCLVRSQGFPLKWANWIEGPVKLDGNEHPEDENQETADVDPGEWVCEWISSGLRLSLGTIAQSYVIERMGL